MKSELARHHSTTMTVKTAVISGLKFCDVIYPPLSRVSDHLHETARFCLVMRGSCSEIKGSKSRPFETFEWDFHAAGNVHSLVVSGTGMRVFGIQITPRLLERAGEYAPVTGAPGNGRGGRVSWLMSRLQREYLQPDAFSALAIEGLAMEMLAEVSRDGGRTVGGPRPRWLGQVVDFLHSHVSEPLHLSRVAAAVNVHPSHLAREFRRHEGCTVGEYTRRLRVERARLEIGRTNLPLARVASDAGFYDQSHFTRTFKLHTGMSPAEYRASLAGRQPEQQDQWPR